MRNVTGKECWTAPKDEKNSLKFGTTKNGAALYAEKELHLKQDLRRILSPKTTGSGLLLWYIPGVIEICMSRTTWFEPGFVLHEALR